MPPLQVCSKSSHWMLPGVAAGDNQLDSCLFWRGRNRWRLVGIKPDQEQIGPGEVVSDAQERLPREGRNCVRAAVTEVQGSRVPALAEAGVGVERRAGVSLFKGHGLDRVFLQNLASTVFPRGPNRAVSTMPVSS